MPAALVTGGGRGIGEAAAIALADAGFSVAVASREPRPERLRSDLRYFMHDVAHIEGHEGLLDQVGPIDCLVNNAGVTSLRRGDLLDLAPDSFDRCVSVNLRGTFFLTQAVARSMLRAPSATYRSIVTVTSINAEVAGVERGDYCMTKAALSMMSKLFAARLAASGIHVFELRPGIIRTGMTAPASAKYDRLIDEGGVPIARWGEPDDVGKAIATIARGLLPFATGEVINVGGGLHLHRI